MLKLVGADVMQNSISAAAAPWTTTTATTVPCVVVAPVPVSLPLALYRTMFQAAPEPVLRLPLPTLMQAALEPVLILLYRTLFQAAPVLLHLSQFIFRPLLPLPIFSTSYSPNYSNALL
jgi:hypothetical protein